MPPLACRCALTLLIGLAGCAVPPDAGDGGAVADTSVPGTDGSPGDPDAGTPDTGAGSRDGGGDDGGFKVGNCSAPVNSDAGTCVLVEKTMPTGAMAPNGCPVLRRDTSGCEPCRAALGLRGFWLKFSCRVGISVVSGGGRSFVRLQSDSQPDYQTDYFSPASHPCYASVGTRLNPNRIGAQNLSMDVPLAPDTVATPMGGANIGMALNGITLFGNVAAPGDDIYLESATFDRCQGHPQMTSVYHHHSEPYSISYDDASFIGVFKDGYALYGRRDGDGSMPALDAYGGHTGVTPDSGGAAVYHYHVNLQTSTSPTSQGKQEWFLSKGTYRGTPRTCPGC
jgi:hypothetical protein